MVGETLRASQTSSSPTLHHRLRAQKLRIAPEKSPQFSPSDSLCKHSNISYHSTKSTDCPSQITGLYFVTVLKAQHPRSRCWPTWCLIRAPSLPGWERTDWLYSNVACPWYMEEEGSLVSLPLPFFFPSFALSPVLGIKPRVSSLSCIPSPFLLFMLRQDLAK